MSLLMEALRKAEAAKRQAGESDAASTAPPAPIELTLEPVAAAPTPHVSPLPNLSQHLDSVDADLATVSTAAPVKKPVVNATHKLESSENREAAERNAARNVFAVKQAPKSRLPLWLFLGFIAFAALGIGGYFWWQLRSVSGGSLARSTDPAPPPAAAKTAPAVLPEPLRSLPATLPPLPGPVGKPLAAAATPVVAQAGRNERRQVESTPAGADSPIRLSTGRTKQNPVLNRAYEALQAERPDEARSDYEQVLRGDPKNVDALLGLATLAARQGLTERAESLYLRALESDPKDVNAQAGLINLKGQGDPAFSESRLRTLLASQPDSPALNFALGNFYARQNRWSDAQQAYFRAYAVEPDNADYLFNLAVSLDHLHQNKLAAQHYQMALQAAGSRTTAFDKNQVKSRLLELQP